ncbi:MAG: CPBP family intramembrane metalloprotease [Ruminococcaceae bacterium]|nr:CPBP family intramembrane metalloprotease [Oscillospiraceae bacterium]
MNKKRIKNYINTLTPHRRACLMLLVFFVLFSVSSKIFSLIPGNSYIATALSLALPVILTTGLYIYIRPLQATAFLHIKKISLSHFFLWFFLGICANATLAVISIPLNKLLSGFFSLPQTVVAPKSFGEYLVGVLCIAIVPAIFEEVFCRGVILYEYKRYGARFAIIASALAYLVLHNSVTSAFSILILGLALGFVALCTDSLVPSMIFHFSVNFFSLTMGYVSESIIPAHLQAEFALALNLIFIFLSLTFVLVWLSVAPQGIKKFERQERKERPKLDFSFSLIIIILIYVLTQILNFI